MGRASDPRAQFHRQLASGNFELALAMAQNLPVSIAEALDLTLLAGKVGSPLFESMAVRWIRLVDDRGALRLSEFRWLAESFEAVRSGDGAAAVGIERFLTRGRRTPASDQQ